MKNIISINNISKIYNGKKVINDITLNIKEGEIYGLIGKNGAGKTTLLKLISGFIRPSSGDITLFEDINYIKNNKFCKVGTLIETPAFYPNLTANENLCIQAKLLDVKDKNHIHELLELVGLLNVKDKKVKAFSLGMKQRLGIALSLVGWPELLILDEPINGLDLQSITQIREMLIQLNKKYNTTIIISSHILGELTKVATCYGIIHNGELLDEISKDDLEFHTSSYIKLITTKVEETIHILDIHNISDYELVQPNTLHIPSMSNNCNDIVKILLDNNIPIIKIGTYSASLESRYLSLTGGNANEKSN